MLKTLFKIIKRPERDPREPRCCSRTSCIQLMYGLWVNLTVVAIGLAFGFSAVTLPQLATLESPIQTTLTQEAWIASVLTLSSPLGCLISGFCMDRFGRRIMLIMCHLPMLCGWMCTGFATSPRDMIIGRTITGIGCGMAMGVPRAYCTEFSLPNMRGVIGAFPNVAMSIGITTQAGLGSILQWNILCQICSAYCAGLLVCNYFLPESPYYVLIKDDGLYTRTRETFQKFRSKRYSIGSEMDDLIEYKEDNKIYKLSFCEELVSLCGASACKPFSLIMPYIVLAQLSGANTFMFYTVEMLQASKSNVDVYLGNVLVAATRFIFAILTAILIYRVRRRSLALISSLGVSVVCFSLACYIIRAKEPTAFPQACFMAYVVFAALGYYTLPFLIMYEITPLQIRGTLGGISVCLCNIIIFGTNKCYPYVKEAIGFPYTVVVFGVCSLAGSLFIYFFLPETKGLTLQEIEEYFNKRRPTLASQRQVRSLQALHEESKPELQLNKSGSRTKSLDRHSKPREKTHTKDSPGSSEVYNSNTSDSGVAQNEQKTNKGVRFKPDDNGPDDNKDKN